MEWLEYLKPVVLAMLTLLSGYIIKKMKLAGDTKETVEFIGGKVYKIYETFVKGHKVANGGKLSEEDKKSARTMLWKEVMDTAKGPVLKLAMKWGQDRVQAYAEKFITTNKREKKE